MGDLSTMLLFFVFVVIGLTLTILLLTVLRETRFWYWRSKGVLNQPNDLLNRNHETALIIRKSIAGMKAAAEAEYRQTSGQDSQPLRRDIPT